MATDFEVVDQEYVNSNEVTLGNSTSREGSSSSPNRSEWGEEHTLVCGRELILFWSTCAFVLIVILVAISSAVVSCARCTRKKQRLVKEQVGDERVFSIKYYSSASLNALHASQTITNNTNKSNAPLIRM